LVCNLQALLHFVAHRRPAHVSRHAAHCCVGKRRCRHDPNAKASLYDDHRSCSWALYRCHHTVIIKILLKSLKGSKASEKLPIMPKMRNCP